MKNNPKKINVPEDQRITVKAPKGQGALVRNFVLIIAVFVIPLLFTAGYFAVNGFGKDINFTEQEKAGNDYLRRLIPLLHAIEDEKNLVLKHVSDSSSDRADIAAKRAEVKKAFDDLDAIDAIDGARLEFTVDGLRNSQRADVRPTVLRAQWDALETISEQPVTAATIADVQKKYDDVIGGVEVAVTHAGDKSNLILDPDLDAYYLMTIVVTNLPITMDRLASIQSFLEEQSLVPAADAKTQAVVFSALLKQFDVDTIVASATTTVAANQHPVAAGTGRPNVSLPDYQRDYPIAVKAYQEPNYKLVDALNQYAGSSTPTIPPELIPLVKESRDQCFKLFDVSINSLDALLNSKEEVIESNRANILYITLGALLLASVLAVFLINSQVRSYTSILVEQSRVELERSRTLQKQLENLLDVLFDASQGKLTVKAPVTEGELGTMADALNLMISSTRDVLSSFKNSASQMAGAAQNLASNSKTLNANAQSQADRTNRSLEQVSELTVQAQEVLKNTEVGQVAALETRKSAEEGVSLIEELNQSISKLRDSAQASGKKVKRLSESTLEIFTASSAIKTISEKIDMAALNSKMAAARAGVAGQEFGVVAQNIADLSESTKKFTNNIETLIKNVQAETSEVVRLTEEQTQEVSRGAQSSEMTRSAFNRIMQAANESAKLVQDINKTASVQATKAQDVLSAISQIQLLTSSTEAQADQTQKTSEELTQLAANLNKGLAAFEL